MCKEMIPKTLFKIALAFLMSIIFASFLNLTITNQHIQNDVSSGKVIDKQIVHKKATLFRDSIMEYILCVEGEYTDAYDKPVKCNKNFYVSEEVYKHYSIDDYFDSKNLSKQN